MIRSLTYSLKESFVQIFRNKASSFASVISITAMLLILGLFFVLTVNVNVGTESIKEQFDTIEVFLEDETTEDDAEVIATSIKALAGVEDVTYISKDQAMEEFKVRFGDNAYLLDGLTVNPLPNSLRVKLSDLSQGEIIAEMCRNTFIGVEDVRYYQTEVDKILSITETIQKAAAVIIVFLILVSIVIVENTIKLTVMRREREIAIMKFVGATNWFIRGPMLIEGIIIGIISALISIGITGLIYVRFIENFGQQIALLVSLNLVDAQYMIISLAWIFLALGISIGAFGSIISIRRYLKV